MIIILHSSIAENATPDEHDTLVQVAIVQAALEKLGFEVIALPFTLDFPKLSATLRQHNPSVVFNLVESVEGRGELIYLAPMLLDQLAIPYTGGNAKALFTSSDKVLAKRLLKSANIATPDWFESADLPHKQFSPDGHYLVKSIIEDGSIGIDQTSLVNDAATFAKVISDRQHRFGGRWFAERYIPGREFNISILASDSGPEVLPIAEIKFIDFAEDQFHIVDYAAKWLVQSKEYQNTPRNFNFSDRDHQLLGHLKKLALACWNLFAVKGYARIDFRIDHLEQPWALEVNVNPALTPDAGFIAAAEKAGLSYERVIERILNDTQKN